MKRILVVLLLAVGLIVSAKNSLSYAQLFFESYKDVSGVHFVDKRSPQPYKGCFELAVRTVSDPKSSSKLHAVYYVDSDIARPFIGKMKLFLLQNNFLPFPENDRVVFSYEGLGNPFTGELIALVKLKVSHRAFDNRNKVGDVCVMDIFVSSR